MIRCLPRGEGYSPLKPKRQELQVMTPFSPQATVCDCLFIDAGVFLSCHSGYDSSLRNLNIHFFRYTIQYIVTGCMRVSFRKQALSRVKILL